MTFLTGASKRQSILLSAQYSNPNFVSFYPTVKVTLKLEFEQKLIVTVKDYLTALHIFLLIQLCSFRTSACSNQNQIL